MVLFVFILMSEIYYVLISAHMWRARVGNGMWFFIILIGPRFDVGC
jgi:hypothetical protein